ncbi:MAG: ribonuclease HII [Candidatus Pacearchaeota archaeon]
METLLLGVDDAGRGPVIGPMIIAGCLLNKEIENELKKLGAKDSKDLTPKRRAFLEKEIKEKSLAYHIEIITPFEIDASLEEGINLNEVEAILVSKIINKLNNKIPGKIRIILDCPSVNRTKWSESVRLKIEDLSNLEIVCEHKADRDYPVVASASILAKEERERQMKKIKKKYGEEVGSGYPSDPKTKAFVEKNANILAKEGLFRRSWKTWQKAAGKFGQKKLGF